MNVGIRGEQAGTTLRGGLVQLLNPSQKTAKMMEKMGIKVTDANGKFLGLAGVIREFQKSMKGMTDAQKLATLSQLVGTEAASGFLALMKAGPGEIEKMTKALENSAGASQKAAKKMMGGLGGALEQLRGSIETMKINIGDALTPIIIKFVKWLTKLVDWFNNLSPSARKFISVTGLVLAVVTGLTATIATATAGFGLFMMSVAPLMPMFTKLGKGISKAGGLLLRFGSLFALLISPVGLVVAGIAALAGGFVLLYKKSEPFRNTVDSIASTLKGKFSSALATASGVLAKVRDIFSGIIQTKVAPFFKNVGDAISKAFNGDFSGIAELLGKLVPSMIAMLVGGIPGLIITAARFMPAIAQGIQQTLPTLLQTISQIITSAISFLAQYLPVFVQTGMTVLNNIAQGLIVALPAIVLAISNILTMVITTIGNYLPTFIQTGVTVLTNLIAGLTQALPLIVSAALTVITTLTTAIANALPTVISAGVTILTSLLSGITQMLPSLVDAALQIVLTIVNAVVSNLPKLVDAGIKILNALIDGIVSILPKLIAAGVTLIISLVVALVKNLPKIISAGAKILTALINGIIKVLPQLIAAVPKIIVAIVSALIKNLPKILAAGGKILLALITGILKLIPQLLKLGPQLVIAFAGAVIKSVPQLAKAGVALIHGLWNGIISVKDWILGKIKGFVDSVVGGFKKFFGIHSPSRVMRDQVGKHVGAGVAEGIKRSTKSSKSAAKSHVKAISEMIKNLEVKFDTHKISATKYISELKKIRSHYKLTGDQARKVEREIYAANKSLQTNTAKVNSGVKSATEKYYSSIKSINDKLKKDIQSLKDNYNKQLNDLTSSIYNQIGLFDSVKTEKVDANSLLQNLLAQNKQMKQFQSDIAKLQKLGVSKDFINELRAMGVDAADEVHAIANMPRSMLNQYIAAWKEKHDLAKKEATAELEDTKKQMEQKIKDLTAAAKKEIASAKSQWISQLKSLSSTVQQLGDFKNSGKVLGKNTVSGIISGLKSMSGPLATTAEDIAKTLIQTIKKTLKIKSPSRVMRDDVGRWIPAGLVEGINGMKSDVIGAAQQMAKWATPDVPAVSISYATPSGIRGSLDSAVRGTVDVESRDEMLAKLVTALSTDRPIVLNMDGYTVAKGQAPYLDVLMANNTELKLYMKGVSR